MVFKKEDGSMGEIVVDEMVVNEVVDEMVETTTVAGTMDTTVDTMKTDETVAQLGTEDLDIAPPLEVLEEDTTDEVAVESGDTEELVEFEVEPEIELEPDPELESEVELEPEPVVVVSDVTVNSDTEQDSTDTIDESVPPATEVQIETFPSSVESVSPDETIDVPESQAEPQIGLQPESATEATEPPSVPIENESKGEIPMSDENSVGVFSDGTLKPDLAPGIAEMYGKLNDVQLSVDHDKREVYLDLQFERGSQRITTKEQLVGAWILLNLLPPVMEDSGRHKAK